MMFGERNGFKAHKEQQTVDIDMSLRNRLYNWMVEIFQYLPDSSSILAYIVDKLGEANVSAERNTRIVAARFYHQIPQSEWYDPYTISGLPLKKFFNTSGLLYKSMGLKDKLPQMSEDEMLKLLATDGMLVKRPLLVSDEFVLVGFKETEWTEQLKNK